MMATRVRAGAMATSSSSSSSSRSLARGKRSGQPQVSPKAVEEEKLPAPKRSRKAKEAAARCGGLAPGAPGGLASAIPVGCQWGRGG